MSDESLTPNQRECLRELYLQEESDRDYRPNGKPCWYRPMDLGARNGSHHSATLRALAIKGLALQRSRHTHGKSTPDEVAKHKNKWHPKLYRISAKGFALWGKIKSDG